MVKGLEKFVHVLFHYDFIITGIKKIVPVIAKTSVY